jgi:hypothetical protein
MSVVPSSSTTTATLNFQLTNYAAGVWNDISGVMRLAERLAPTTPVPGASGQYKDFSDKNSFDVYATARALGGEPNSIEFEATDAYYNCAPQALQAKVDKKEDQDAGAVDGNPNAELVRQLLDQGKIRALLNNTALSHVKSVVDYVLANSTALPGYGLWYNAEMDPMDEINQALLDLVTQVGSTNFIKITFDLGIWNKLRAHPKLKARLVGVQVEYISVEQFKSLLIVPGVDVEITNIIYNTAALGQAKSKKRVMDGTFLIHYAVPNATVYDPSAFKTFTVGPSALQNGVRTYWAPHMLWRAHLLDWSRDIKLTGSLCLARIDVTLTAP